MKLAMIVALAYALCAFAATAAQAASATSPVVMYRCVDGVPGSANIVGSGPADPSVVACDADARVNGVCTFAGACPLCSFSTPRCLAPCYITPEYIWAEVPAGRTRGFRVGRQQFLFRCGLNHAPRPR